MPAPLGNQYAVGNKGGRPKVYDEDYAIEEAKALDEWSEKEDSLSLLKFYGDRGYGAQRAIEMEKNFEVFRESKRVAMARLGARREIGGLLGVYDSAIVRCTMATYDLEHRQMLKEMKTESLADDARALMVLQDKGKMDVSRDKPTS